MGHRWFEAKNKPIVLPFGFGLSYTTIANSNIKSKNNWKVNKKITVSINIENTGKIGAKEVVQFNVSDKKYSVPSPLKELKGFKKLVLKQAKKTTTFELDENAFNFWNDQTHKWRIELGEFEILVGASSQDLPLRRLITVQQ